MGLGSKVGRSVGMSEENAVGAFVGKKLGWTVLWKEGAKLGAFVIVGRTVGAITGAREGSGT